MAMTRPNLLDKLHLTLGSFLNGRITREHVH